MWRAMFRVCPEPRCMSLIGLLVLGILVLIIMPRGELMAQPQAPVRAPEFPEGMQWLNTDKPVRLADLRGKVVDRKSTRLNSSHSRAARMPSSA